MPNPQFDTWRKLMELAAVHKTKSRMRKAMAEHSIVVINDEPPSGYYRMQVSGRLEPIGIWRTDRLYCFMGSPATECGPEQTIGCVWMPVSRQWYLDAVAGKGWPDVHSLPIDDEQERGIGDNSGASQDELAELADKIGTSRAGVKRYVDGGIKDETMLAASQSLRADLNKLARVVQKKWEDLAFPLTVQLEAIKRRYSPLVKSAKAGADEIRFAQEEYQTNLLRARQEEQRRFEAAQRAANEQREAEAFAAQQVLDEGQRPAQPSFIKDPEPPKPVAPTTAIKGGSGRAASVKTVEVIERGDVTNWLSLLAYLKDNEAVQTAALKEANKILTAHGEIPPGCTTRTIAKVS